MTYTDHRGELEAIRQDVDWTRVRDAYSGAYRGVFDDPIRLGPLAILLAHSALETGRWKKGLWNWNFGNIKASVSYIAKVGNLHQYYRLNEYLRQPDGSMAYEWFDPAHPQTRMRAYRLGALGAAEKVRFLGTASNPAKGNRYQKAWDALLAEDPAAVSRELHAAGYYTAKEAPYTKALVSLHAEFRALLDEAPPLELGLWSPPLNPDEYDHSMPLHSGVTDADLASLWIGQPLLGLPDELRDEIAEQKRQDNLDMYDK
jgi:hypothetical protein